MFYDKVDNAIETYGNTSSVSVLLALSEVYQERRLRAGETLVLAAFRVDLTWAVMALEIVE